MVTYRYYRTERAVVLAFAAVAISFATMVACGGFAVLREPVFSMALLPAVIAVVLAYPFMLGLLVSTRLDRSLPVVSAVTVVSTWITFVWLHGLGLGVGLLVSIASMRGPTPSSTLVLPATAMANDSAGFYSHSGRPHSGPGAS